MITESRIRWFQILNVSIGSIQNNKEHPQRVYSSAEPYWWLASSSWDFTALSASKDDVLSPLGRHITTLSMHRGRSPQELIFKKKETMCNFATTPNCRAWPNSWFCLKSRMKLTRFINMKYMDQQSQEEWCPKRKHTMRAAEKDTACSRKVKALNRVYTGSFGLFAIVWSRLFNPMRRSLERHRDSHGWIMQTEIYQGWLEEMAQPCKGMKCHGRRFRRQSSF